MVKRRAFMLSDEAISMIDEQARPLEKSQWVSDAIIAAGRRAEKAELEALKQEILLREEGFTVAEARRLVREFNGRLEAGEDPGPLVAWALAEWGPLLHPRKR